jgi:hypothetical protein
MVEIGEGKIEENLNGRQRKELLVDGVGIIVLFRILISVSIGHFMSEISISP